MRIKITTNIIFNDIIYTNAPFDSSILQDNGLILHSKKDIFFNCSISPPGSIFIPVEQFNFENVIAFSTI